MESCRNNNSTKITSNCYPVVNRCACAIDKKTRGKPKAGAKLYAWHWAGKNDFKRFPMLGFNRGKVIKLQTLMRLKEVQLFTVTRRKLECQAKCTANVKNASQTFLEKMIFFSIIGKTAIGNQKKMTRVQKVNKERLHPYK